MKKYILNIVEGDILLVDNPNIVSKKVMEFLEDKMLTLVTKSSVKSRLPITILNPELIIKETDFFAFSLKKNLKEILNCYNSRYYNLYMYLQ